MQVVGNLQTQVQGILGQTPASNRAARKERCGAPSGFCTQGFAMFGGLSRKFQVGMISDFFRTTERCNMYTFQSRHHISLL